MKNQQNFRLEFVECKFNSSLCVYAFPTIQIHINSKLGIDLKQRSAFCNKLALTRNCIKILVSAICITWNIQYSLFINRI